MFWHSGGMDGMPGIDGVPEPVSVGVGVVDVSVVVGVGVGVGVGAGVGLVVVDGMPSAVPPVVLVVVFPEVFDGVTTLSLALPPREGVVLLLLDPQAFRLKATRANPNTIFIEASSYGRFKIENVHMSLCKWQAAGLAKMKLLFSSIYQNAKNPAMNRVLTVIIKDSAVTNLT